MQTVPTPPKRLRAEDLRQMKGKTPIVSLTAYTASVAERLDNHAELLLVGDSLAMTIYGLDSTVGISLDTMIAHGAAVVRGSKRACIAIDLPAGTYEESAQQAVEAAGAFATVVEATVEPLARAITETISIPTIGIGASAACDGQILVVDDILGLYSALKPKFVKRYVQLGEAVERAAAEYAADVRARRFPGPDHVYGDGPGAAAKDETVKGAL